MFVPVVMAVLAAFALAACGSSNSSGGSSNATSAASAAATTGAGTTGGKHSFKGVVTIAYIDEVTGALSYTSSRLPAQAAVDAANAAGGINGYKINMKIYDGQSQTATGVAALRQAINDHVSAVLAGTSTTADSGLNALVTAGIPGFASGDSPGWFSNDKMLFPWQGNALASSTTAWMKYCIGNGRTKLAVPAGTTPGAALAANAWSKMAAVAGGRTVFERVGIDSSNSAAIQSVAQQIKNAGAQCVASLIYPGSPQLQVALNQLGGNIPVVEGDAYGPQVQQQFGSAADGLLYADYTASLQNTGNPGVKQYLDDMAKYERGANPACVCAKGYATAEFFLHVLSQVKGTPTPAKIAEVANKTNGYDENGFVPPIQFPRNHTQPGLCLGYSELKNGKWTAIQGTGPNGFVCGQPFKPSS